MTRHMAGDGFELPIDYYAAIFTEFSLTSDDRATGDDA